MRKIVAKAGGLSKKQCNYGPLLQKMLAFNGTQGIQNAREDLSLVDASVHRQSKTGGPSAQEIPW